MLLWMEEGVCWSHLQTVKVNFNVKPILKNPSFIIAAITVTFSVFQDKTGDVKKTTGQSFVNNAYIIFI